MIKLNFENVQNMVNYIVLTNEPSLTEIINIFVENGITQEEAENKVHQFIKTLCNFLGIEENKENFFNWIKTQANNKDVETISEQLIGVFGTTLSSSEIIVVYKNGKLYKEFAPLNIVKIKFNDIFVNLEDEELFVLFKYRDEEYKTRLVNSPEKFKKLYKARCILNGNEIPQELENTDVKNLNLEDLEIYFNLNNL